MSVILTLPSVGGSEAFEGREDAGEGKGQGTAEKISSLHDLSFRIRDRIENITEAVGKLLGGAAVRRRNSISTHSVVVRSDHDSERPRSAAGPPGPPYGSTIRPGMLRLWQVWHLGRSNLGWNDERGRNPFVRRRKSGIVRLRQLRQMAVGGLPPALNPTGKPGDVVIVGHELERHKSLSLESRQERRPSHRESIVRSLRQNQLYAAAHQPLTRTLVGHRRRSARSQRFTSPSPVGNWSGRRGVRDIAKRRPSDARPFWS